MIEEVMKKDVGKIFSWQGKEIIIMKSFSCYEGDFYEYRFINDEYDNVHRINIWTSEGNEFIKALEEYKSP